MNAPAQIISALILAGAAAFFFLAARFDEAGILRDAVQRKSTAEKSTAASPTGTASAKSSAIATDGAPVSAAGTERIPAGVSAAEASQTLLELANLDGKMLSSRRIIALLQKVMSLPASHMEEARSVIQGSKNPIIGGMLYAALFSRWGELDPETARASLSTSAGGNPIFKMAGAASLAGGWLEKDPDSFFKWLNEEKAGEDRASKELRRNMLQGAMASMGSIDPATAEKLIASSPKDRRAWMILDMAEQDPNADPRAAAARALEEAGADQGQRGSINWRIGRMLADRDPKDAIKYAEEQKPEDRGSTYDAAMSAWVSKDRTEAMKWLKEQPENVQTSAVNGLKREVRDMDYADVAKLSGEVSPAAGSQVWNMALQGAAERDPKEALRYLPNISADGRPHGYEQIAIEWTKKDPQAASEWINPLPPGKEKDGAIQGMVQELGSKEPDSSTIWASSISDENVRFNLVTQNASRWLKRDRPAAEEWINSTDTLTDEQKAKLLPQK